MGRDYIPFKDAEFDEWLAGFTRYIEAHYAELGLSATDKDNIVAANTAWKADYQALLTAKNAARAAKGTKDQTRDTTESLARSIAQRSTVYPGTTNGHRAGMGITVSDTKPTPRPVISTVPIVGFDILRGGSLAVSVREEEDQTRPSMHPAADIIECKYILVAIGEAPPKKPSQCPETQASKKAQFKIHTGIENAGKRFYGFFRWANQSNPANNGSWSDAQTVVIA